LAAPAAGYEVVTTYDQQGFPVTVTQAIGAASAPKHYNEQGFLITTSAAATALDTRSTQAPVPAEKNVASSDVIAAADSATSSSGSAKTTSAPPTGAANRLDGYRMMGAVLIVCGVMIVSDPFFW
jgi:hypothetical protein